MKRIAHIWLIASTALGSTFLGSACVAQETAAPQEQAAEPEANATSQPDSSVLGEVLVMGEQPGPRLLRVTKGDHVLWILATYGPLPKKMTWRSREVESIIAESQRVVRWVGIDTDVDIGFFAGLAALPSLINAGNNPDNAKLKDVVPAELYERWLPLKEKYLGRDRDIEDLRPSFAILQLRSKAQEQAGLTGNNVIWPTVEKLAKRHKVKVIEPQVKMELKIDKPRAVIKKFRKTHLADVECFGESLARLETDLEALKTRANAWAIGNIPVLKSIPPQDPKTDCSQMLVDAVLKGQLADEIGATAMRDRALEEFTRVMDRQRALWVETIEKTMQEHASTLALVPIEVLLNEQSPLDTLRERGYDVDEP